MIRRFGDPRLDDSAGMEERVILVDERDHELGSELKLAAHRTGSLHRAFSVFVLDGAGRILLQRRAAAKYHSSGLWSNTCCGHPRPGEPTRRAARRRLREEMGFECELEPVGEFLYRARIGDLVEHEYDHVFVGRFDGEPEPHPGEVAEWRWTEPCALRAELGERPEAFTVWLAGALAKALASQGRS